ncbi:MAG: hypothetical protein A2162_09615 [Deltaproteobacteria bacterium RBG_13_52_11b]|nr:MAG: hypothetical protein A2162_09615 [Deltaproteobacteria bacterium RBG_13_52_11b]
MEGSLQGNRDRIILEIVKLLLRSEVAFQEIFSRYGEGRIRFSAVEHWVDDKGRSLLFNLKEQCHALFREKPKGSERQNEWLLDLVIGSIFHEAMKLRENLYQLEIYRPRYIQYRRSAGATDYEKDYIKRFERIIARAEQGVAEGMEETRSLYRDAMAQLIDLFKENAEDPFWVRFLLEQEILLQKVYGPKRTREIFRLLFGKDLLKAYHIAGQSYLESGHYDLASLYFSKSLRLDPHHNDTFLLHSLSRGMSAYYQNSYPKALSCFGKLTALKWSLKATREQLQRVEEVCRKISVEMKEEKGVRGARRADSLAEQIGKML